MSDQKRRDRQLAAYEISFPSNLDSRTVLKWIKNIASTPKVPKWRWQGRPTTVLEVLVTGEGITYRTRLGEAEYRYMVPQLTTAVPGASLKKVADAQIEWDAAIEYGETHSTLPLDVDDPEAVSESLIRAMQRHKPDYAALWQIVISPMGSLAVPPKELPKKVQNYTPLQRFLHDVPSADAIEARRTKLKERNVLAVMRLAVKAPNPPAAQMMLADVTRSLSQTAKYPNRLKPRKRGDAVIQAILDAKTPLNFPAQLSATELLAFMGWPIGSPNLSGLPTGMTRQLPASTAVAREGIVIGRSTYSDDRRPVALTVPGMTMHTYICGPTGCLHPNTPIHDPVDDTTKTVRQRYLEGKPFHVFALDGDGLVIAQTSAPVEYKRAGMYRLYNGEHSVTVTGQHRVWTGRAYVEVDTLYQQQESALIQLPTISAAGLSRLRADAQRWMQIAAGFQPGYRPSRRYDGLRLRPVEGSGLNGAPLQAYAHGPCFVGCDVGGRAHTPGHNHPGLQPCRISRSNYRLPSSHAHGWTDPLHLGTCGSTYGSLPSSSESVARSNLVCTARYIDQPALVSTPVDSSCAATLSPQYGKLGVWLDWSRPRAALSPIRHNLDAQAPVSPQFSPGLEPPFNLPFSDYSDLSTFRAQPVGDETYYDFHVPIYENYLACGLIHHNSGKSVAAANIFHQHVSLGLGAAIIETKGEKNDLYHKALTYIPADRLSDVIVVDVTDVLHPVGFNILQQGEPQVVATGLEALFNEIYGHTGVRLPAALYHALMVLMTTRNSDTPLTFADLPLLYAPMSKAEYDFADHLIRGVPDPEIRRWWQQIDNQYPSLDKRNAFFEPLNQRAWQLNGRPEIRNIFGQSKSSFDLAEAIRQRKIVLVNLAGLGSQVRNLVGSIFIDALWGAIKSGSGDPERPFLLGVDEFQNYPVLGVDFQELAREARAFGLSMMLANQTPADLPLGVMGAVLANVRNTVVYQADNKVATIFANEFGQRVSRDDFLNLGNYEAICRVMGANGRSHPFTVHMQDKLPSTSRGSDVIQLSRERYSRPRSDVEQEIASRRNVAGKPKKKVVFGEEEIQ